jgi:hypothetical protein
MITFCSDQRKSKIIELDANDNQNIIILNIYLVDYLNDNFDKEFE